MLEDFVGRPSLTPFVRYELAVQICSGLSFLHAQQPVLVHGDIKGSNVIVQMSFSKPLAKLVDFGLSRLVTKHVQPLGGTVRWMAPEIIRQQIPAPSSDVFSFGRLLFMISTGKQPLANMTRDEMMKSAEQRIVPTLEW